MKRKEREASAEEAEVQKMAARIREKQMTAVPLKIYFNEKGKVKVLVGLGRGKNTADRRQEEKSRKQSATLNVLCGQSAREQETSSAGCHCRQTQCREFNSSQCPGWQEPRHHRRDAGPYKRHPAGGTAPRTALFILCDTPGLDLDETSLWMRQSLNGTRGFLEEVDLILFLMEPPAPTPFDVSFLNYFFVRVRTSAGLCLF